ncbi:MAG: isopenicillin N synthase family dioxygenase [Acidimicrobiia bacterium]
MSALLADGTLVPLIDITGWADGDAGTRARIARQIDDAARVVGFLQIVGHGVPASIIDAMLDASDAFFARPLEAKLPYVTTSPEVNRGFTPQGAETLTYSLGLDSPPDLFEAFNIGPDAVPDDPVYDPERHRLFAPNIWPDDPAFRAAYRNYFDAMVTLAAMLDEIFAVALSMEPGFFWDKTDHSTNTLRVLRYERQPGTADPLPGQMRMGSHTDYGISTILYADQVPGLQVLGPDECYHDVVPAPGAYLINIGDLLAQWTNDRWRSTLHRVVPPPAQIDGPSVRRSAAFFHNGNYDALIECIPTCCSDDNPPRYAPIVAGKHLMSKIAAPRNGDISTVAGGSDTVAERIHTVSGLTSA